MGQFFASFSTILFSSSGSREVNNFRSNNKQKRGCQISILFRLLKLYLNPGDRKSPILSWSFASLKTHGEYIH